MNAHQYVLNDYLKLASLELGEANEGVKTIVFIHGWMDNAESFSSIMKLLHLSNPHFHLIAIDLPGHGLSSSKGSDNFYPFLDYIDDLHSMLHKISSKDCILVGHSLGALISSCYSAAFPEKVAALIEIEGYGPLAESTDNVTKRLRTGILSRQRYRVKETKSLSDPEDAVRIRAINTQLKQELIKPMVYRALERKGERWYWRHDTKLKCDSLYRMSERQRKNILSHIQCPHLVILGESGFHSLKVASVQEKEQEIRRGKQTPRDNEHWVSIPGGHHCHLEHPEKASKLILDWLNKV